MGVSDTILFDIPKKRPTPLRIMPYVSAHIVGQVTYMYALCVIGGGAFGLYSKGSKASLIASTVVAMISVCLAFAGEEITWYLNAVYSLGLTYFFSRKLSSE